MANYLGYRVTSNYGERVHPIRGTKEFHKGIDLVISHQAPIKAFIGGTVVHAKMGLQGSGFGNYGKVVAIVGNDGFLTVYAHLDSISVGLGDEVKAGQVIGTQGNTGASAGSHLHFEVRAKTSPSFGHGSHVDPVKYLDKALAVKPKPVVHIVERGEYLSEIAIKHKTTVADLMKLNKDIDNPNEISVGQKIRVK